MKILWLCNMILPKISAVIGVGTINFGGWLSGLSNDLLNQNNIELSICFPMNDKPSSGQVDKLHYYGFRQNQSIESFFENVIYKTNPDIIHIFGTECPHTLSMINVCKKLGITDKVVINIQGLVSICERHYFASLPQNIINRVTLRDILKNDSIRKSRNLFKKRGEREIIAIQSVKHIVGRTDWDKACTEQINPNAAYHFCNETLRDEFYRHNWDINSCEKHSIFVSQCGYPIKGFHLVLEAMQEILKKFPDSKLYTTGVDPLNVKGKDKLKQTYYQKYLAKLIKQYELAGKVIFLGDLCEKKMCDQYLSSNVFVSPSSIENSPNSLGEAMILGVPTVTSDVGGVKNMLTHNEEGFIYQYDAPYMLAYYVCKIFGDNDLALKFSESSKRHAQITHNREINLKTMLEIYDEIHM